MCISYSRNVVPHFLSEVFEPLAILEVCFLFMKRGASCFIRGLSCEFGVLICTKLEPLSNGSDSTPPLMASLFNTIALVKYRANFVSDF
jgi:hypothetical protein